MKKKSKMMICAVMFSMLSGTMTSFAGEWKADAKGYWYEKDDGGYAASEWMADNGKWYYIGNDGYMVSNGWVGNYFVGADGAMLVNTTTPDGYQVGADGAWISGQTNYPAASYAAFMRNNNMFMYGYWESPDSGYGAIRGEVSDVVDCGDYYELKNQVLTQAIQYNTKKEAEAAANRGWNETAHQLPNGKYCLIGNNDFIVSEVVYQGSIYINKDVVFSYPDPGNYERTCSTTFADYLNRIEEIGKYGNGNHIGAIIKGIDEKGYVTSLEYALDYFW